MSEIFKAFWAKKSDVHGFQWLSLHQHLLDTKNVIGALFNQWLNEGQRQLLVHAMGDISEDEALRTIQFIGATHDLGKATPVFQKKIVYRHTSPTELDNVLMDRLAHYGFEGLNELNLYSTQETKHAVAGQWLLENYGINRSVSTIIGAHHGVPATETAVEIQTSYLKHYYQSENKQSEIYQLWDQSQREIIEWALSSCGFSSVEELPEINQYGQVLISGLLIVADWIASNDRYFPLISIEQQEVQDQNQRIQQGWSSWYADVSFDWDFSDIVTVSEIFQERFGFQPREVQKIFAETIQQTSEPGLYILEAPMGIGKTEAALAGVELLAEKTHREGLFFGLPTQATSNGIFKRLEEWLERVPELFGNAKSIQLMHGKAMLNDDYASLPESHHISEDTEAEVITNQWFSGRKTGVLERFIVGTVDQFLLAALKQKHLAMRHLGFSQKVVVIDEVHAYDAYMNVYLYRALEWMGAYRVPVILLSATLPPSGRQELIAHYLYGSYHRKRQAIEKSAIEKERLESIAYPVITYTEGETIQQVALKPTSKNKSVNIKRLSEEKLFGHLDEMMTSEGVVGVIVNTVKRSQQLYQQCAERFGEENVYLLHSQYIATDRQQKEAELLKMIGKHAKRPEHKIIIGTQVIEQSLDIDFDVLITDLCPMDLLIQRIGRLHRHTIERPEKYQKPMTYVLGTSENYEFESGSQAIYGEYLLAATQTLLPDKINLPSDISYLVRQTYDDKELQQQFSTMYQEYQNAIDLQKQKAKAYAIKRPSIKKSMLGWLTESKDINTDEKAYAQVRDSEETIEVIPIEVDDSGKYRMIGKSENIANRIDMYAKELAKQTLRLPTVLAKPYMIDQTIEELEIINRRHFANWQQLSWLKGSLALPLNNDYETVLNGYKLKYNQDIGLLFEKLERSEDDVTI